LLQDVYKSLRKLAENIKGPFFRGEFGLVDIAIAPWIVRDFVLQEHRGFKRGDVSPVWEAYAERVEKRDSVVRTSSVSANQHIEVYMFERALCVTAPGTSH
jgi:glutathione S-transferase